MKTSGLILFGLALSSAYTQGSASHRRVPLGTGYKSLSGQLTPMSCVDASQPSQVVLIPNPEANLSAGFAESRSHIEDKFSIQASAKALVWPLTLEGGAEVSLAFAETDLKTSAYFTFSYVAGNILLTEPDISPFGRGLLNSQASKLYAGCGDEYVYQVQLGARIHVGFEFTFHNKAIKNKAQVKLRVSDPTGIIGVDIGHDEDLNFDDVLAGVNLIFLQEGGDLNSAERIRSGIPKDCFLVGLQSSDAKSYLTGHEHCLAYFREVILPYARDDFAKQIKKFSYTPNSPLDIPGLNVLKFFTKRYEDVAWRSLQANIKLPASISTIVATKLKPYMEMHKNLLGLEKTFANLVGNASTEYQGLISTPGPSGAAPIEITKIRTLRLELNRLLDQSDLELARCQGDINDIIEGNTADNLSVCSEDIEITHQKFCDYITHLPEALRISGC